MVFLLGVPLHAREPSLDAGGSCTTGKLSIAPKNVIDDATIASLTTFCSYGMRLNAPNGSASIKATLVTPQVRLKGEICGERQNSQPKDTFVLIPGYGLPRASMLPYASHFSQAGNQSLLVDLPGQGESSGENIGFGYMEAEALKAALDQLTEASLIRGRLVVLGVSYGASTALILGAIDPRIDAVIAVAPFSRAEVAVARYASSITGSENQPLSGDDIAHTLQLASKRVGYDISRNQPIDYVRKLNAPVLFIAGGMDDISDIHEVREMLSQSRRGSILFFKDADHFWLVTSPEQIEPPVDRWLSESVRSRISSH